MMLKKFSSFATDLTDLKAVISSSSVIENKESFLCSGLYGGYNLYSVTEPFYFGKNDYPAIYFDWFVMQAGKILSKSTGCLVELSVLSSIDERGQDISMKGLRLKNSVWPLIDKCLEYDSCISGPLVDELREASMLFLASHSINKEAVDEGEALFYCLLDLAGLSESEVYVLYDGADHDKVSGMRYCKDTISDRTDGKGHFAYRFNLSN